MTRRERHPQSTAPLPDVHGARELPSVSVRGLQPQLRDKDGFIGDQASQTAFRELLDAGASAAEGKDPLGGMHSRS